LGVFRGAFDVQAAAVVADEPRSEEFLLRLVEAHLVSDLARNDYLAVEPRYRLLNAAASHCRARLGDSLLHWRQRHAGHYATLADAATQRLQGTEPRPALELLSRERENLAAALETALEIHDLSLAARLGEPLW